MSTYDDVHWQYNCLDCVYTRECGEVETANLAQMGMVEVDAFQQSMFWPVLEAMKRGIAVDAKVRQEFAMELMEEMDARMTWIQSVLGHPLNPRSPLQMAKLFYTDFGQPELRKRGKGGVPGGVTCDDDALRRIASREPLLRELIRKIAEYRSLGVFLSTFVMAPLDEDGRMRTSYNICGTETFRFSSSENAFGSGCFPPGAEVLTKQGWIALESVTEGQVIAAYSAQNSEVRWESAKPFTTEFSGDLLEARSEQYRTRVTPGHRILATKAGRTSWQDYHAGDLAKFSSGFMIPIGGELNGGTTRFSAERLLVASLADGSYEGDRVRFSFKKERKSQRLITLCAEYGVELTETFTSREGYRRFWFRKPADWPQEKKWGIWVYQLALPAAKIMLAEVRYWDATDRGDSFWFFTADKVQAELVQDLAHITGKGATVRRVEQSPGSYSDTVMYVVNVKPRAEIRVDKSHWSRVHYTGPVYCVSVPSTYFLVRWQGFVSVTGNTNLQNVPKGGEDDDSGLVLPNVRKIFVPDPEHTLFDTDLSKADLRIVVWESDEQEMKAMLREGRDPYIEVAREFYRDSTITKTRADGSENPKYRLFKSFCHGTHYLGTPHGLSQRLGLTVHESTKTQNWYLGKFPKIREWQTRTIESIKRKRYVENAFGYRRYYFDRMEDSVFREAIAWIPQSTVALYINRIWKNIWDKYPHIWVMLQVHDSLVGQFPTYRKKECMAQIAEASNIVIPYADPLIIPTGVKTSERSWGDC